MSDPLVTLVEALKTQLAAAYPSTRVVTRDLQDFNQRSRADLLKGVYTIITIGEGELADYVGREAELGKLDVIIVGQIEVAPNAAQSAIEDAEFAMATDLKAFCGGTLTAPLDGLYMRSWRGSGQLEHPYGWISCQLEAYT